MRFMKMAGAILRLDHFVLVYYGMLLNFSLCDENMGKSLCNSGFLANFVV